MLSPKNEQSTSDGVIHPYAPKESLDRDIDRLFMKDVLRFRLKCHKHWMRMLVTTLRGVTLSIHCVAHALKGYFKKPLSMDFLALNKGFNDMIM